MVEEEEEEEKRKIEGWTCVCIYRWTRLKEKGGRTKSNRGKKEEKDGGGTRVKSSV